MRSKPALWKAGIASAAVLAVAAGCSLVTSYDGFVPGADSCPAKRIPDVPTNRASGSGAERLGAMSALHFLSPEGATPLGYDLDKLCTCPAKRACSNPQATDLQCDLSDKGIDNAAGGVLPTLFPPEADGLLQQALAVGLNGLVVRIQGWDGSADDPDVDVSIYNVVGLKGAEGGASAKFDGNDEFIVDDKSLIAGAYPGSNYTDTSAFVVKGVLVASFDFDFRLAVPNIANAAVPPGVAEIPFTSAHLIGKIERVGTAGLRMTDAQFVGRLPVERVLAQLPHVGLCGDSPAFAKVKERACAVLDLPANPASDGKNVPCDAMSFGMGVTISPAKLGGHAPAGPTMSPCPDVIGARCP
jgi:hypothetical protein